MAHSLVLICYFHGVGFYFDYGIRMRNRMSIINSNDFELS